MRYRRVATGSLIGELAFSRSGVLGVVAGVSRYLVQAPLTVLGVRAAVGTAPVGSAILIDVDKNGTTIFTTQAHRASIAAAANATSAEAVPDVSGFIAGDYLTVDIDQIGSGTAGSDLMVVIRYQLV